METLLLQEREASMGRTRPTCIPCHRARPADWSMCERNRVMGATARMPHGAASWKARIGEPLLHALASRKLNRQCTSPDVRSASRSVDPRLWSATNSAVPVAGRRRFEVVAAQSNCTSVVAYVGHLLGRHQSRLVPHGGQVLLSFRELRDTTDGRRPRRPLSASRRFPIPFRRWCNSDLPGRRPRRPRSR